MNHTADPTWLFGSTDLILVQGLITIVVVITAACVGAAMRAGWRAWKVKKAMREIDDHQDDTTLTSGEERLVTELVSVVGEQMRALSNDLRDEIAPALSELTEMSRLVRALDSQMAGQERRVGALIMELHEAKTELHQLSKTLEHTTERLVASMADIAFRAHPRASTNS